MKRLMCGLLLAAGLGVVSCPVILSAAPAETRRSATQLPYRFPQPDAFGNTWMVYPGGRLIQQGNMPFCSDSGMFTLNGQPAQMNHQQQAMIDGAGEIILENIRAGQFTITRRVAQVADGGIRICDIIRNPRAQEAQVSLSLQFNVNYGVQSSRPLTDPRKTERTLGSLVTDGQNRSGVDVYAGKGSKIIPTINAQPNNSQVQVSFDLKIPASKEVAIVHFHNVYSGQDQAEKFFASVREPKILSSLPPEVRKLVVNFPTGSAMLEDVEMLRGGANDIVELTNGDQLRGTLLQQTWELSTAFGKIQVPTAQMVGVVIPPGLQQRHLLITTDGEIIGGQFASGGIELQLSTGQKVSLPVGQISRVGRKTPQVEEEPEAKPTVPMVYLRSGDRLAIQPSAEPLKIATRFGILGIKPETLVSLDLQPENTPSHLVTLTDGSRFSGLLLAETLEVQLVRGGKVSLPSASIRKLAFAAEAPEAAEAPATLALTGEDALTVSLAGKLGIITSYGEVQVNGAEIKRITRVKNTVEDIQLTLWDESVLTGRLAEPYLQFGIAGGAQARVPVGLIEQYSCPLPQPSSSMVEQINKLVADLNADDWKLREKAEADLLALGQPVLGTLRQLRASQPPEAQQRIDSILKQLSKGSTPAQPGSNAAFPVPMMRFAK